MNKSTPGPWAISKHATPDYAPQFGIYANGGCRPDFIIVKGESAEADATLIAAAPNLLTILEDAIESYKDEFEGEGDLSISGADFIDWFSIWRKAAKEAVVKATIP